MIDLRLPALDVAPRLLGSVISHWSTDEDGRRVQVGIRITEVEAYMGLADPASHAMSGPGGRAAVMFGPPAHLYVYLSYGIHRCVNIICSPDGQATGVLLRAGEVVCGQDCAKRRRSTSADRPIPERRLASGPGNLGRALGAELSDSGASLAIADDGAPSSATGESGWRLAVPTSPVAHATSPRIGISRNAEKLWRFTIPGDPTVSRPR